MLRNRRDGRPKAPSGSFWFSRRTPVDGMRQQVSRDLYSYWNVMRGARAAPERTCLDPAAIRPILADTFLLEVDAAEGFLFRVTGARVNALWRTQLKGTSFLDLWRKEDRLTAQAALMAVVDGVEPLVGGARARAPGDMTVDLEFMLLPLRHFGSTHSRVLGAFSPVRPVEWIGQSSAGLLEFLSMRIVDAPEAFALEPPAPPRSRPRLVVCNQEKP